MGCRIRKIDIIREHIVLGKVVIDILELCRRADQLVIVICRHRIGAIDLVCRRSRFCPTLIPDMRIAAIRRCIRMEDNGTRRRMNICRIEDADTPAVDLDLIRRDRSHIDDIGFANICHGCAEWRCPAARERRRVQRRLLLCRDIEIPYVHGCCLAEDYAVRVDEVDVTARIVDCAIDGRRISARHDVQIVLSIVVDRLALLDRVVCPLDHVIRGSCRDIGILPRRCRRASDSDAARHIMLPRRCGGGNLRNQKSARDACEQCIAHTLCQFPCPILSHDSDLPSGTIFLIYIYRNL